ncbi:MAG: DUF547 domain-containing protein [Desulfofustis sp.]|nr:DUF547 domain-containing protein [Desulfofustis sp.]NNK58400.1 DUF547 domain-containing protein [Desulfofustis sp.]
MDRLATAIRRQSFVIILIFSLTAGCTSIRPPLHRDGGGVVSIETFDYSSYAQLLDRYLDEQGLVDYAGLLNNPDLVDLFYKEIGAYSPDSHPHLFSDDNARLAYWINSYNLTTIKGVLHSYPISSVEDVAPPALLFFLPRKSGFFFFQRFTYGGVETSLYYLENSVIRKRFADPRYHFALNCASSSCPQLPRMPFYPDRLDEQLERESKKFINSVANVRYDAEQKTLYLSAIFSWYEEDFLNWLDLTSPGQDLTIVDYLLGYLDEQTAAYLRKDRDTLKIDYLVYDWGLNDQRGRPSGTSN